MVKILNFICGLLSPLLIVYLFATAVFAPFFTRSFNFAIFPAVYVLLNMVLLIIDKRSFMKMLNGLSAFIVLLLFITMTFTPFRTLELGDGAPYLQPFSRDTLELRLLEFNIHGEGNELSYSGLLQLNRDTVKIGERGVKRFGSLHIADVSHILIRPFTFYGSDTLTLFEGQTGRMDDIELALISYDPATDIVSFRYHDILFNHPVGSNTPFLNGRLKITRDAERFGALLTYREIRPLNVFIAAAALFILLFNTIFLLRKTGKNKNG